MMVIAKFGLVFSKPAKKLSVCSAAVALLLTGIVRGQQPVNPWVSDAERERFEQLRDEGSAALYNLDYAKARADFDELLRLFPQHPVGPQYLATALLVETLYNSRRLQSSLFSTDSPFYSKGEDSANPEVAKQFWALTGDAQRLALARRKQYPKDTEALYYLGNVAALKATFEETVERRHSAALSDGCDAVELHRQVVKLDPTYADARLTIGTYDYIVGSLPFPLKLMAGFFGAHGSKKRGLATIERVAKEGTGARDQAQTLLVVLYAREKRYGEAAEQARQLSAKYPRNYLYRMEAADALISQAAAAGKADPASAGGDAAGEAFAIYEALLRDKEVAGAAARMKDLIHFKYGEALMKAGHTERAAAEFLAAARAEGAGEELATMAHLHAAQALDAGNKRAEAVAQYRLVLSRPDVYDAHDEARKGLREPYKAEADARMKSR
jgi:hypothetical protein